MRKVKFYDNYKATKGLGLGSVLGLDSGLGSGSGLRLGYRIHQTGIAQTSYTDFRSHWTHGKFSQVLTGFW